MKRSWPGTSTTLTRLAARQGEPGEAEVDGHRPRLLLGQAVGVDAGQRLDEGRFAVVDVAGGADDERPGRSRVEVRSGR